MRAAYAHTNTIANVIIGYPYIVGPSSTLMKDVFHEGIGLRPTNPYIPAWDTH